MARYGNQINQVPIDMYSPLNIGFYSDILDKAQGNLNQGAAMQAKFLEDTYGQKYIDKATRDAQVGKAEQSVAGLLDADFISPANVIKGVSKASQGLAPWRNLNEKQLELAKAYEEDKRRLGMNFLSSEYADPSKQSLTDKEGNLINSNDLRSASMNTKDIYDNFSNIYGANLLGTKEGRVKSDIDFKYKIEKIKGLSKEEKLAKLSPGTKDAVELANGMMRDNPELSKNLLMIYGDKDKASQALQELNLKASFDDKYAQTKDTQYLDNDWGLYMAKKAAEAVQPESNPLFSPNKDDVVNPNVDVSLNGIFAGMTGKTPQVNFDKMQFDPSGQIVRTKTKEGTTIAGGKYGNTTSSGVAYKNEDYQKENLEVERLRLAYMKGAKNSNEMKTLQNLSPKQLVDITKQASINAARYYSTRGLTLNDNLAMQVASPFRDETGNYRDAKNSNLQYYDENSNTWVDTSPNEMADKFGVSGKDSKTNLQDQLAKTSTNTISFNDSKGVKMKSSVNIEGKSIPIRFDPYNTKISTMFEPQRQIQQIQMTPGDHTFNFNGVNYKLLTTLDVSNGVPALTTRIIDSKVSDYLSKTPKPGQKISDYDAATLEMEEAKNAYDSGTDLLGKTNQYAEGYGTNNNIVYRTENPKKNP